MSEELMTQNTDTQPEVDPTSPHYQNDPSFIDENQTPEAQEKASSARRKLPKQERNNSRKCNAQ